MNNKTKNIVWRIFKIIWLIIGGLTLFWTLFWYIKMHTVQNLGVIAVALLFASGVYILLTYSIITIIIFLVKFAIKKFRKKP